jgi:hypothetical protein
MEKVFSFYKVPLLISITLGVVITALGVVREPLQIAFIFLGTFLGTFVLDLEYLLNAVFIEPERDFSKTLIAFIKHNDFLNAAKHIQYHKDEFKDKSLNSALFQIIIGLFCIFVIYSTESFFAKALVLSVFANSIYVMFEYYYQDKMDEWFWTFKAKPSKQGVIYYIGALIFTFSFCLYIL